MIRLCMAAVLALGLGAGAASAQIAPNSSAPVDITADEGVVINSQCLSIWRGDAEALQDTARLRAKVINVYSKPKPGAPKAATPPPGAGPASGASNNCGPTDRLVADGDVYYVTPEQSVHGDHAVYVADTDIITVTGNVVVVQGKNVARGDKMTMKVKTGEVQMESNVKGRAKPGRVRGVFYSEDQAAPATPAPPATPPARTR